jgi:hypothetical protein
MASSGFKDRTTGSALVLVTLVLMVIISLSGTILLVVQARSEAVNSDTEVLIAGQAAESGLALRLQEYNQGVDTADPVLYEFADGSSATVVLTEITLDLVIVDSTGSYEGLTERLNATLEAIPVPPLTPGALGGGGGSMTFDGDAEVEAFDSRLGLPGPGNRGFGAKVQADGQLTVPSGARVNGNVKAKTQLDVLAGGRIDGSATAVQVNVDPLGFVGSIVETNAGGSYKPVKDAEIAAKIADARAVASFLGNKQVGTGTYTLGPGTFHFDELDVDPGGTLELVGPVSIVSPDFDLGGEVKIQGNGEVTFLLEAALEGDDNIRLESGGTFTFGAGGDYGVGHVEIWADGWVRFDESNFNVTNPPKPRDFQVYVSSNELFELYDNAEFYGVVYNPNGNVMMGNSSALRGAIVGNGLSLALFSEVLFDEAVPDELPAFDNWRRFRVKNVTNEKPAP